MTWHLSSSVSIEALGCELSPLTLFLFDFSIIFLEKRRREKTIACPVAFAQQLVILRVEALDGKTQFFFMD